MRPNCLTTFAIGLSLSGCAELTTIYHARKLAPDTAITVDSYQRSTYVARISTDPAGQLRLCAEAAPDTFAALSASLAAEGDVVKKSASVAAAIAQSGATIERTQTINLLRESMYRTCERYLSGAMDKSLFYTQAARDQRTMLAVLAIEQLTRTVRPPSTVLGASGTSAAIPNSDAAALIKQFADEKSQAQKAATAADTAYAEAKKLSDCTTIKTAPAADPELKNWAACNAAKVELDARNGEAKAASERLDKLLGVTTASGAISASTTASGSNPGGGGGVPSDEALKAVASAVRDIALTSGIDETLMFCIASLTDHPEKLAPATVDMCNQIIKQRFQNDEQTRGKILSFRADGTDISVVSAQPTQPGDMATPILKKYLTDSSLAADERKRRNELAGRIAVQLRLIDSPQELAQLVFAADYARSAALLEQLRLADNTPQGTAALKAQ